MTQEAESSSPSRRLPNNVWFICEPIERDGKTRYNMFCVYFETRLMAEAQLQRCLQESPGSDFRLYHALNTQDDPKYYYAVVLANGTWVDATPNEAPARLIPILGSIDSATEKVHLYPGAGLPAGRAEVVHG